MKHHLTLSTSAAALILCVAPAHPDSSGFTGFYAPDTWTITGADIGEASAIFAPDGSQLVITGGDAGFEMATTVTHTVLADGLWTFDWSFIVYDSPGFDLAYYVVNGEAHYIRDSSPTLPITGSTSVSVQAGDVIGWLVITTDGIFGPGVLTITDFRVAPVPGPAAFALLGFAGFASRRRR